MYYVYKIALRTFIIYSFQFKMDKSKNSFPSANLDISIVFSYIYNFYLNQQTINIFI